MKKMNKYFEEPTQVLFYVEAKKGWLAGIAYQDSIIDLYEGDAYLVEEIIAISPKNIFAYTDWISIAEEMVGDDLPEGMSWDDNGTLKIF